MKSGSIPTVSAFALCCGVGATLGLALWASNATPPSTLFGTPTTLVPVVSGERPTGFRSTTADSNPKAPETRPIALSTASSPSAMEVATLVAGLLRGGARNPAAPTPEEAFRLLQSDVEKSIFLIHSTFAYESRDLDGSWIRHTSSTWGTAFVAHRDGYLMTNKHLVAPWKFDTELCALVSTNDVKIVRESTVISAWPAGTRCLDDKKQPLPGTGFSTIAGTLHLVAEAPDSFALRTGDSERSDSAVKVHALDDADLAILRIDSRDYPALQLASEADEAKLSKLCPVMTVGFPRGNGGLEGNRAETSASTGALRKAEATLHVTTPIIAGNSGGPLITPDGRVVGIATRIYSETLGIGIRIRHARALLEEAIVVDRITSAAIVAPK